MPDKITEHIKGLMRSEFERGVSKAQIARNYGVSVTTVTRYQKEDGWEKPDLSGPGAAAEAVMMTDEPDLPTSAEMVEQAYTVEQDVPTLTESYREEELQRRIVELEAQNAELVAKVEKLKDTRDVSIYTDRDSVIEVLGIEHLRMTAINQLIIQNLRDRTRGILVDYEDPKNSVIVDRQIETLINELLRERTSHMSPLKKLRVVKMVKPDGQLIQVPMEEQIQNMKGEQSAPMAKARAKGWQLAEPYLCQAFDCWLPATKDPVSGELNLNGYCSPEHRALDPYLSGTQVSDVTTTAHIGRRDY